MTEIEAKVSYVKLARSLKTYGVSFFLVKVRKIAYFFDNSFLEHMLRGKQLKSLDSSFNLKFKIYRKNVVYGLLASLVSFSSALLITVDEPYVLHVFSVVCF